MARKKSAPIRREVDRFHPDSLEARSVNLVAFGPGSESDDEAIDDSDYEQCNNLAAESKSTEESEWILNYSLKDFFPNRLDSIRSDDFIGWIECSRKLLPVAKCSTSSCHSDKPCVALHIAGKDLLIVCNICRSCLLQSSNTASSVALCRSLQQAVNTNTIRLRVSSATTTTIEIWLNPTSPQLSSILLNWALMGSTLRRRNDSGGWYEARPGTSTDRSIENQFSALQFLDSVTTAQSAMRKSDSTELLQHLKKLGVRTKLRDYQLQGVQWMHDRLTPRHHLPQLSTSSANMTLALEDWQYNAVGWVRLSTSTPPEAASAPAPAPGSSSDRSGSSSGNSNTSCQSTITWYNIHTEEIVHSDKPPVSSALQLPTSLILADEMGVGKSLQIISLVLLLLSSSPAPSAYNAPTLFTNAMDVDAPERASSENTQNAGEGGDFAGAGDSGEYWMDTAAAPALSAGSAPAELVDPESSGRSCLCGSSEDLANKTQRLLGWIQCASCYTWLHAPCAGFFDTETMQNCAEYTCLACSCLKHYTQPVQSRTTLIVMPNTLITQWKAELLKHVEKVTFNNPDAAEGGLKVFIYPEEVGNKKSEDYSRLDPRTLVRYDIVLLSFKALQKGYHDSNVDYTSTRILRCSYAIYPPAFMCLHYALVVVDETQNIESTTSQVLSMALRIPSTHRISVSGTPFGTGKLADLYTLCQFLRVEPYASDRTAWLRVIEKPAVCITAEVRMQYLREVFQRLLLRRTKQMIHAELGLPEHTVITKPLQFSTFERALYDEKLGAYCNSLLASAFPAAPLSRSKASGNNSASGSSSSSSSTVHAAPSSSSSCTADAGVGMSAPAPSTLHIDLADAKSKLELLRKGCCHPQVLDRSLASSKPRSSSSNSAAASNTTAVVAGPRPLDEIMIAKVEQTRLACEEYQRVVLFNLFAMAGATVLQAQCASLQLTGYHNAGNYNIHHHIGETTAEPSPAWFLSQAYRIYHAALALIDRHRRPTVLIALVKLTGDEALCHNDCLLAALPAGSVLVPHSQEGLHLTWQLKALHPLSPPPLPPQPSASESGSSGDSSVLKSEEVCWQAFIHPHSVLSTVTSVSPLAIPPSECIEFGQGGGMFARLMFANNRRISGFSAKVDVTDVVRRFCHIQHDLAAVAADTGENLVRYQVLLLPAKVALQAGVGSTDNYSNVCTENVAFPTATSHNKGDPNAGIQVAVDASAGSVTASTSADASEAAIPIAASVQKSKKWQLCVKAVHSVCLVLRAQHRIIAGQRTVDFTHAWLPVLEAIQLLQQGIAGESKMLDHNDAVKVHMAMSVRLNESSFDTDALQELHVCHNVSSLSAIIQLDATQLSQFRALTSRTIHSSGQSSSMSQAFDFQLLNPAATVTVSAAPPLASATPAAMPRDKDAMNSLTQRASAIEKEFLEAANGRRLVADCNLGELSAQVADLDQTIDAEIGRVQHHNHHKADVRATSTKASAGGNHCGAGHDDSCDGDDSSGCGTYYRSGEKAATLATAPSKSNRAWWNELLTSLEGDVQFQASLQGCIEQGESAYRKLANFSSTYGLQYLLGREFDEMEQARRAALKVLSSLSKQPTAAEILESTDCQQCRQYFNKTGPVCAHCKKQAFLKTYATHILCFRRQSKRMVATSSAAVGASPKKKAKSAAKTGVGSSAGRASSAYMLGDRAGEYESDEERVDFEVRSFDEGAVDGLLLMVLKQLRPHAAHFAYLADKNDDDVDSADGNARAGRRSFKELCALEIKRQECLKSELSAMMAAWDRYSDLLKAHDELAQSKTRMSLLLPSIGGAANTSAAAAAGGLSAAGGTGGATDGATGGSSASARKGGSKTKASTSFREPAEEESALHLRPYELPASIAKSYSAVLQADGELKRSLGSLQFYKEQVREIFAETHEEEEGEEEEVSAVAAQHDSTTAAATNSGTATSSAASVNMAGETSAGAGAAKAVFSTPSKARVQACLFCRDELQLGNPLHSPTRHRSSLPTEEGGAEERPTLTEEVVVLPCAHRYHRNCVTKWVQKHKACPLCKAKAAVSDFIAVAQYAVGPSGARLPETPVTPAKVSSALSSTIAGTPGGVVQAQSPVKSVRFIERSAGALSTGKVPPVGDDISATTGGSRFATTANSDKSDTSSGGSSIQPIQQGHSSSPLQAQPQQQQRHVLKSRLKGKWGTKVDTLVMDLLELTLDANRQDEKAIVFSQWIEMVDIVAQALHANNISHVKCANRNKDFTATGGVEVFRNNATVRVIVMPLALGAEGLDLIVASHVFLLEPLLNIHQELQAVNRISRLGQQKRTYVHKYVIANTIEERIVLVQNRTSSYTGGDSSDAGSGSGGVSGDVKSVYSPSKGHKQRSDDDFLSESDLCFILGIQAHTVGGNGDTGAHSAHATDNTIQVEGNVAAIGSVGDFGRGAAAVLTATINGGENGVVAASNSVEGGDGHGSDGGGEDESFGVMDLSSNLLDHFE